MDFIISSIILFLFKRRFKPYLQRINRISQVKLLHISHKQSVAYFNLKVTVLQTTSGTLPGSGEHK